MSETIDALTKLAQDLTDRVDELSKENDSLKKELDSQKELAKKASAPVAPKVSEQVVDATLDALVKAGALQEDQRGESRKVMLEDMEAPHRILQRFLDAQGQAKVAAASDTENVSGGTLANATKTEEDNSAVLDRMMQILNM